MDSGGLTKIKVTVKLATGAKYELEVEPNISVEDFKALLAEKSQIPSEQQRLIYSGHVLKNEQTIDQFGS
jgi:ubiquilin